jgi:hypothetical protein
MRQIVPAGVLAAATVGAVAIGSPATANAEDFNHWGYLRCISIPGGSFPKEVYEGYCCRENGGVWNSATKTCGPKPLYPGPSSPLGPRPEVITPAEPA